MKKEEYIKALIELSKADFYVLSDYARILWEDK